MAQGGWDDSEVDYWISGVWADPANDTDEPGIINYEELTGDEDRGVIEVFTADTDHYFIKPSSESPITRCQVEQFYNAYYDRLNEDLQYFIGYCTEDRLLLYVDVVRWLNDRPDWVRYTAEEGFEDDTPPLTDNWRTVRQNPETTLIVNDYYAADFEVNVMDTNAEFTYSHLPTINDQFINQRSIDKMFRSLKAETPDLAWFREQQQNGAGIRLENISVSFVTNVEYPELQDFDRAFTHYRRDEEDATAMKYAFNYALDKANGTLFWFFAAGFTATNWYNLGFEYDESILRNEWHDKYDTFIDKTVDQAVRAYEAWAEGGEGANPHDFLNGYRIFPGYPNVVEFKAKIINIDFDAINEVRGPYLTGDEEDESESEEEESESEESEPEEERVGWESSIGRKRGRTEMSSDVITTMQLECEWLSDITDQEKERKYREARANLTPSDEGFFRTQHSKKCGISFFEDLFVDLDPNDPSKHEYRFASEEVVVLDCGHLYHKSSLQGWKNSNNTWSCPICRQKLKRERALAQILFI